MALIRGFCIWTHRPIFKK